jgi:hypothetical protein
MAGRRGLLLPQVPVEHHWDRTTFLEQTCRKAGLPLDAWQKGANRSKPSPPKSLATRAESATDLLNFVRYQSLT